MAQHIETKHFKQKRFREIEESIEKAFNKGLEFVRKSSRFEEDVERFYAEGKNDLVFLTSYSIPNDIVWKSNEGAFEIHYNKRSKSLKIYLVA